jgi:hypothetical protein
MYDMDGDSGAISMQEITSSSTTPQGVSFKCGAAPHPDALRSPFNGCFAVHVGLSHTNSFKHYQQYHDTKSAWFAVHCDCDDTLWVSAPGGFPRRKIGTWISTDIFKVQAVGTTIQYLKNDQVLYTSLRLCPGAPHRCIITFPLHVDVSFTRVGDSITDASIYSASTGASMCSACPDAKYSASSAPSCSDCPDYGMYPAASARDSGDPNWGERFRCHHGDIYYGALIALFVVCGLYTTIAGMCMFFRRNNRDPGLQQWGEISSEHWHGSCSGANVTVKSMTGLSLSVHADEHVTVLALKKYIAHQQSGGHYQCYVCSYVYAC